MVCMPHRVYNHFICHFTEEALSQTTTSGGQEQSTSSPQATFFFPSSFDPPRDTSTNAGEDSGVACQHRFEHCPVESSVDPDN